jgi:hypothetical protein
VRRRHAALARLDDADLDESLRVRIGLAGGDP